MSKYGYFFLIFILIAGQTIALSYGCDCSLSNYCNCCVDRSVAESDCCCNHEPDNRSSKTDPENHPQKCVEGMLLADYRHSLSEIPVFSTGLHLFPIATVSLREILEGLAIFSTNPRTLSPFFPVPILLLSCLLLI